MFPESEHDDSAPLSFHVSPALVLQYLWKRRLWMMLGLCLGILAGLGAAMSVKPVYEARTVMIRHQKNPNAPDRLYQEPSLRTLLETVRLRDNLVVLKKRLALEAPLDSLYKQFDIRPGHRSDIVQILARAETPKQAARLSLSLSEIFQERSAGLTRSVAQRDYAFRKSQQKQFEDRLIQAQDNLAAFQKKHNLPFFEARMAQHLQHIQSLEEALIAARLSTTRSEQALQNMAQTLEGRTETVKVSEVQQHPEILKKRQLAQKEAALLKRYTSEHPAVQAVQEEMIALEVQGTEPVVTQETFAMDPVVEALKIAQAGEETALPGHRRAVSALQAELKEKKAQLTTWAAWEKEMKNLQREIERASENLRENAYQLNLAEGATAARVSSFDILESADPPEQPLPTRRKLLVLGGALAGLFLSTGLNVAQTVIKPHVWHQDQLPLLGISLLGQLKKWGKWEALEASSTCEMESSELMLAQRTWQWMEAIRKSPLKRERPLVILVTSLEKTTGTARFMERCTRWFSTQQMTLSTVRCTEESSLFSAHLHGESEALIPAQHTTYTPRPQLPVYQRLETAITQSPGDVVLWELPPVADRPDWWESLLPHADGVVWLVEKGKTTHGDLKKQVQHASNIEHQGVWYDT